MSLESKIQEIGQKPLPAHVAVIMDGNGRWAKTRGLDRSMGHVEGVNAVRRITEIASDLGVKYLTLYTFSTENWNRPQEEVDALMHLISIAIERETPDLVRNNVRLKIIGDTKTVPDYALDRLRRCEETTASCTGMWMVSSASMMSTVATCLISLSVSSMNAVSSSILGRSCFLRKAMRCLSSAREGIIFRVLLPF